MGAARSVPVRRVHARPRWQPRPPYSHVWQTTDGAAWVLFEPRGPGAATTVVREVGPAGGQRCGSSPAARRDQRLKGGMVPKAIERVLDVGEPMRARDIHAEVEGLLGMSVPASSVENWLAKQAQDPH